MADGMQNLPDLNAQMAQAAARNASANAGKPSPLLNGLGLVLGINLQDVNNTQLSPQGKGFNIDGMINKLPQGKPSKADKLLQAYASLGEGFSKAAKEAGVMYSGPVTNGTSLSNNAPSGAGSDVQLG